MRQRPVQGRAQVAPTVLLVVDAGGIVSSVEGAPLPLLGEQSGGLVGRSIVQAWRERVPEAADAASCARSSVVVSRLEDVPVIVISGGGSVRDLVTHGGADAWLSKPVDSRDLRGAVRRFAAPLEGDFPAA